MVISEEIYVEASLETTFASLLVQMGRQNETPDGKPLPMILEPRPGGRWYRDLGGDNGHLWGFVQSIKRPSAPRNLGAAIHLHGRDVEPDLPPVGIRRRHAHHIPPFARRSGARRIPPAHGTRLVGSSPARQESRRGGIPIRRPS